MGRRGVQRKEFEKIQRKVRYLLSDMEHRLRKEDMEEQSNKEAEE